MRSYSIVDLLVGQFYNPASLARRYRGGEITFAEKREDIFVDGHDVYAIRYRVQNSWRDEWATIAVKVGE